MQSNHQFHCWSWLSSYNRTRSPASELPPPYRPECGGINVSWDPVRTYCQPLSADYPARLLRTWSLLVAGCKYGQRCGHDRRAEGGSCAFDCTIRESGDKGPAQGPTDFRRSVPKRSLVFLQWKEGLNLVHRPFVGQSLEVYLTGLKESSDHADHVCICREDCPTHGEQEPPPCH